MVSICTFRTTDITIVVLHGNTPFFAICILTTASGPFGVLKYDVVTIYFDMTLSIVTCFFLCFGWISFRLFTLCLNFSRCRRCANRSSFYWYWLRLSTARFNRRSLFSCIVSSTLFGSCCFGSSPLTLCDGCIDKGLLFFCCCIDKMFIYICKNFLFVSEVATKDIQLPVGCRFTLSIISCKNLSQVARLCAVENVSKQQSGCIRYTLISKFVVKQSLLATKW